MSGEDILDLLAYDLAILLGHRDGKDHYLFWDAQAYQPFVAIVCARERYIVTVLPVDYHENLAWTITPAAIRRARNKVSSERVATGRIATQPVTRPPQQPPVPRKIRMTVYPGNPKHQAIALDAVWSTSVPGIERQPWPSTTTNAIRNLLDPHRTVVEAGDRLAVRIKAKDPPVQFVITSDLLVPPTPLAAASTEGLCP